MFTVSHNHIMLQVAWIHIDRQMILTIHRHVISRVPRFSVSHDNQKTWQLHVSGVQQEDRGFYMCQVNTNPMISQVGFLQVVGMLLNSPTPEALSKHLCLFWFSVTKFIKLLFKSFLSLVFFYNYNCFMLYTNKDNQDHSKWACFKYI